VKDLAPLRQVRDLVRLQALALDLARQVQVRVLAQALALAQEGLALLLALAQEGLALLLALAQEGLALLLAQEIRCLLQVPALDFLQAQVIQLNKHAITQNYCFIWMELMDQLILRMNQILSMLLLQVVMPKLIRLKVNLVEQADCLMGTTMSHLLIPLIGIWGAGTSLWMRGCDMTTLQ
jgi:hypothetical protein